MSKFFGDKKFYKMVFAVVIPIILQDGITCFVGLLDNIMVGLIGTEQMSGVAIANQLIFVFNLAVFGAISGAGIFGAQFHGHRDSEGVKNTLRFKLIICSIMMIFCGGLLLFKGETLISLFLSESSDGGNLALALKEGNTYIRTMLWGFLPFILSQSFASTLRETGETVLPMKAGIIAVFTNLILNYLLIFGKFGFPEMGVAGAALATVISRYVEFAVIISVVLKHKEKYLFVEGILKNFRIPSSLVKDIVIKGSPLLLNEIMWSMGMSTIMQCYSVRGLNSVAALNIAQTVANLFDITFLSMGSAISIIVGQQLGAGEKEKARDTDNKLIVFGIMLCLVFGSILAVSAPFIPKIYNTSISVKHLATKLLWVRAAFMPVYSFVHCCYFTLRTGGKTVITFFFDSFFTWVVVIPIAFILAHYTDFGIVAVYALVQSVDIIKCVTGFILVKQGSWLNNLVTKN